MGKSVRIISAGGYDTRGSDVAANIGRDRRFINYYRTVDQETAKRRLEKRPGFTSAGVLTGTVSSYPYGTSAIQNYRYGGAGYTLSAASAFTSTTATDVVYATTSLGQVFTAITPSVKCFATQAQTSANFFHLLAINCGALHGNQVGQGWFYTVTSASATGALTQIVDADFPTTGLGPLTQKWGYVFYMTQTGDVYNSDLNSVTAWTAGSFLPCNAVPDMGMGVWENGVDLLAAFGTESTEILYNAGRDVLSPLLRANGGVLDIGLVRSTAICYCDDSIAFVGRNPGTARLGVYLLNGMRLTKISTPTIDQYLQTVSTVLGAIHLSAFQMGGSTVLLITISTDAGVTVTGIACRIQDQFWFEWATSATEPVWPVGIYGSGSGGSATISGGLNNSRKVYNLDEITPAYDDGGNAYTGTIQMTGADFGSDDDKTLNSLSVVGDKASATDALVVALSDDDGASFSNVGTLDMSTEHRKLSGLGAFRKLGVRLTHSTAVASRIEAVDVNVSKWGS